MFLREMTRHLRALLTVKVVEGSAASLLQITEEDEQRYRTQAALFSQERLIRIMNNFMTADSELRFASAPRIGLEIAALKACQNVTGEDVAALTERLAELEIKVHELPRVMIQQEAADQKPNDREDPATRIEKIDTKSSAAQTEATIEKPTKVKETETPVIQENEKDPTEIWKIALKTLAATEPATYGILKRERFIGARGNVYHVQVPQERKNFSFLHLKKQNKMDAISKALTEAAGQPLVFEPLLEGESDSEQKTDSMQSIQMLSETVGRDLLQIDESEDTGE